MSAVFLKLLDMSITAGWVIMAVIVLRFLLRRGPKWLRCVLWAIVAVRLVCPFSFESAFSLIPPGAEIITPAAIRHNTAHSADTGVPVTGNTLNDTLNTQGGDSSASVFEVGVNPLQTWVFIGSIVWVGGLVILSGYGMLGFFRIRRRVDEGIRIYENVYLCDNLESAFILGVIRPRIYLPSDMPEGQFQFVLAHERTHLKRKDHWWKALGYVLLSVYWFNPLVWAAYILLCRDIELACDERAVRDLNLEGRKEYSRALVACSMKRRMVMTCPLAFGEVGVKERVRAVLHYRKPAFWLILAALAVCAAAGFCFLTDPRKSADLAEMIEAQREELTEQIGMIISDAESSRYLIADWELIVRQIEGERADCYFGANWIPSREAEDDPLIQGMYQTANSLSDEALKALALETARGWLTEMQSWSVEEYLEQPIVIMLEGRKLALYYPYVMGGVETLIPLQEFVDENWTEDAEKRYQEGVGIIEEALGIQFPDAPASGLPESNVSGGDTPESSEPASGLPESNVSGGDTPESSEPASGLPESNVPGSDAMVSGGSDYGIAEGKAREGVNYYDLKGVDSDSLLLDEIEWIWSTDSARAAEIGFDFEQHGAPYYIYNETVLDVRCSFAEECSFTLLEWQYNSFEPIYVNKRTFLDVMAERESVYSTWAQVPFIIEIKDGKIVSVTEQYIQ